MRPFACAFCLLLFISATSSGHYTMLLPDKPWAEKGEKVTFTYQFGHPFEHELFDAPKPAAIRVFPPRGAEVSLEIDKTLKAIKKDGAAGKKVTAWQFTFTPAERGDYAFVLRTGQFKLDEVGLVEDTVRVVLHVQTQNGWDRQLRADNHGLDIWPETRPYGLLPGMIFKGRVVHLAAIESVKHVVGLPVEFEKYNESPSKKLPPDELITFKTKVDTNGYFVAAIPESGWWGITARTQDAAKNIAVVNHRATTWIYVDEKK